MAVNRIVVDAKTKDPMSARQLARVSAMMSDWLQAVGLQDFEVEVISGEDPFNHGHVHVSNNDRACDTCAYLARDGIN